jgi:hypothetical protein
VLQVRRLAFVLHTWAKYLAHYKAMAQRAVLMGHFDGWLDVIQRKVRDSYSYIIHFFQEMS